MNEKNQAVFGFAKLAFLIREIFFALVSAICFLCAYETSTKSLYFFSVLIFLALFLPADFYFGQRPDAAAEEA